MIPMSKTLSLELLCLICLASKLNGCGARVRKQDTFIWQKLRCTSHNSHINR